MLAEATPTLAFLLRLKHARIGCVLVHYSGKDGNTYRGSSKLATTFEVILGLKPLEVCGGTTGAAFRLDWTKYRREPCEAVRSREVRLGKDATGKPEWTATATMDDDTRRLLDVVMFCQFASQRAVAAELGWDAAKVSRMKTRAISAGLATEKAWELALSEARSNEDPAGDGMGFWTSCGSFKGQGEAPFS